MKARVLYSQKSSNVETSHFLKMVDPEMVRIPDVMNPEIKKEKERQRKEEGRS
eukprot:TRINITY_DN3692_c0_g1_i1.p2 TRINITY_DN3692_c0_g1~~TRINITY_DN3692_c0_g1_i1.p2  ORF type:complete len:53 (-),score=13.03 TRINITY_DN3692_c0_g1_i1:47-205(-)